MGRGVTFSPVRIARAPDLHGDTASIQTQIHTYIQENLPRRLHPALDNQMSHPSTPKQQHMTGSIGQSSPSPRPLGDESFYLVDDNFHGGASSMHAHQAATNGWSADVPSTRTASQSEANDGFSLPPSKAEETENGSTSGGSRPLVDSTSSAKSDEATSQWGEDGSRSMGTTPTLQGMPRSQPTECVQKSPRLTASGSALSQSTPKSSPPASVCTQERPNDELIAYYDNDWIWFAAGAIAVAGTMLLGKHFYRTLQGRPAAGKPQRSH